MEWANNTWEWASAWEWGNIGRSAWELGGVHGNGPIMGGVRLMMCIWEWEVTWEGESVITIVTNLDEKIPWLQ